MRTILDTRKRTQRIAEGFHALGRALTRITDESLHRAAGYASFEQLPAGERLSAETLAYELIAVADANPAAPARSLGGDEVHHLLAYTEAPTNDFAELSRWTR